MYGVLCVLCVLCAVCCVLCVCCELCAVRYRMLIHVFLSFFLSSPTTTRYKKIYLPLVCDAISATGFFLPVDWNGTTPPAPPAPGPSPGPGPSPAGCTGRLQQACPLRKFKSSKLCLTCSRKCCASPTCSPKERQAYCDGIEDGQEAHGSDTSTSTRATTARSPRHVIHVVVDGK